MLLDKLKPYFEHSMRRAILTLLDVYQFPLEAKLLNHSFGAYLRRYSIWSHILRPFFLMLWWRNVRRLRVLHEYNCNLFLYANSINATHEYGFVRRSRALSESAHVYRLNYLESLQRLDEAGQPYAQFHFPVELVNAFAAVAQPLIFFGPSLYANFVGNFDAHLCRWLLDTTTEQVYLDRMIKQQVFNVKHSYRVYAAQSAPTHKSWPTRSLADAKFGAQHRFVSHLLAELCLGHKLQPLNRTAEVASQMYLRIVKIVVVPLAYAGLLIALTLTLPLLKVYPASLTLRLNSADLLQLVEFLFITGLIISVYLAMAVYLVLVAVDFCDFATRLRSKIKQEIDSHAQLFERICALSSPAAFEPSDAVLIDVCVGFGVTVASVEPAAGKLAQPPWTNTHGPHTARCFAGQFSRPNAQIIPTKAANSNQCHQSILQNLPLIQLNSNLLIIVTQFRLLAAQIKRMRSAFAVTGSLWVCVSIGFVLCKPYFVYVEVRIRVWALLTIVFILTLGDSLLFVACATHLRCTKLYSTLLSYMAHVNRPLNSRDPLQHFYLFHNYHDRGQHQASLYHPFIRSVLNKQATFAHLFRHEFGLKVLGVTLTYDNTARFLFWRTVLLSVVYINVADVQPLLGSIMADPFDLL